VRTPEREIPRWARAADAATIALVVLAAATAAVGGYRLVVGGVRLSVTSAVEPLTLAFLIAALRHWRIGRPSLPRRLARGWRRLRQSEALAVATPLAAWTRLLVLAIGVLAVGIIGFEQKLEFRVSENELWNLPARWDAGWYVGIATEGYYWSRYSASPRQQVNVAFFPAYPYLMRAAGFVAGARTYIKGATEGNPLELYQRTTLAAGTVLSILLFWWALVVLYKLAREDLEADRAAGGLLLLATYPFAVYFSAPYTEALFLLSAVCAFYAARRERWLTAGAWGLTAGLTRPNGFFLSLPLALVALQTASPWLPWRGLFERRFVPGPSPAPPALRSRALAAGLTAAAMPTIGMLLFTWYLYRLTGRPFVWMAAHRAWGRTYEGLWAPIAERFKEISLNGWYWYVMALPIENLNLAAVLLALALLVPVTRRFGLAYGAFVAISVIPPVIMGGTLSMGRVSSVLFPTFLGLAALMPAGRRAALAAAFAMLQGLLAALFFTWRPPY
jgi:hypothetical protein